MKGQQTGMRGVYLVAAELARLGFTASPTARSAVGADILVTDEACTRAFSIQVKTNAGNGSFWLLGRRVPVSPTHVYVLVNLKSVRNGGPEFFVVPSEVIRKHTRHTHYEKTMTDWWSIRRTAIPEYRDRWNLLGDPHAEVEKRIARERRARASR